MALVVSEDKNFNRLKFNEDGDTCVVTGLSFPRKLSEMYITWTNEGPMYMGLWGKKKIRFDVFGLALIPLHLRPLVEFIFGRKVPDKFCEKK